ncbi:peptide chain release factor 2 [Candidatus Omnitrophota bacterium]
MLDELTREVDTLHQKLDQLRVIFDVDAKQHQIDAFQEQMSMPGYWQDTVKANKTAQELKALKACVESWQVYAVKLREIKELLEATAAEDNSFLQQIKVELDHLSKALGELEFTLVLSGEFDKSNAILSINAGAGGTESCDWVSMLLRMYQRWAESKRYKIQTVDILPGEEAGVKNVTLRIIGLYAYGYLKAEKGVHRLVRISPFDANKRRHTSFASVDAIPEIEDDVQIALKPEELKIDVYRSSGPGGQSVNTTDSAIRITHLPTGIVAQCQNERSQHQNKQVAMKILKARVYELEQQKQQEKMNSLGGQKQKIEWGSQIRSYVMHPYTMVKDHRTNIETGNVGAVMDGTLDMFIQGFLEQSAGKKKT